MDGRRPGWAGTLLTLLKFLTAGPRPTPAGLLPLVLSPTRGRWEAAARCLHYNGAAGDTKRRRWRQLLPADATLDAVRGLRLDTPTARLDRGFTLS